MLRQVNQNPTWLPLLELCIDPRQEPWLHQFPQGVHRQDTEVDRSNVVLLPAGAACLQLLYTGSIQRTGLATITSWTPQRYKLE
jgi:hypothetical protein